MAETFLQTIKVRYAFKAVLFCAVFTISLVLFSFFKSFIPGNSARLAYGITSTLAAFVTTFIFLKFDKITFADIGLKFELLTIPKCCAGVLIGILLMGLMSGSVIYFSDYKIELNNNSTVLNFLLATSPLILLSLMEEIGFRAYPLMILKGKLGPTMAIIITSLLFAIYHIANGWTVPQAFLGPGVCGIIFGLSAIRSNGISMPTGIHYAFNLTTSAFGISNQSVSLWILKQKNGLPMQDQESSFLTTLIPQFALLIFGIVCMGLVLRKWKYNQVGSNRD